MSTRWAESPFLDGHVEWRLARQHVLGLFTLDMVKPQMTKEWKEFLSYWRMDDKFVHVPIMDTHCDLPGRFFGARLKSGYEMHLSTPWWTPFCDWWQREVVTPVYGKPMLTHNLDVAIITNIHLFKLAVNYHKRQS